MRPLRLTTTVFLMAALASCQSSVRMTALDRALVKKTITPTSDGGVQIQMEGSFLANPTAAIETFHTLAQQKLGTRPYRYQYALDKKQITRTKATASSSSAAASSLMPALYGPVGASGASFGEAAIIFGSIALIVELVSLLDKAPAATPAATQRDEAGVVTETVQTRILQVSGTATPIAPVVLDRSRLVEVLIPNTPPTIGKLKPAVSRGIADSIRSSFEKLGMQTLVGESPKQNGYVVRSAVLRAQGNYITYSTVTVEVSLHDQRSGKELTRMVVQVSEKPFDLKSQSERQQTGVATGILTQALDIKLKSYVK